MIVTIDGPAGAGKSSAAKALAQRLGFEFLDTGAMFRAVTLAALEANCDFDDPDAVERLLDSIEIEMPSGKVLLNGSDVTQEIRRNEVTESSKKAANSVAVREKLAELQRETAAGRNIVCEGRDQGTIVFPDAECKFFLSADARERARRRHQELLDKGESVTLDEVHAAQLARDQRDVERKIAPLVAAPDAIHIDNTHLDLNQVVDQMEEEVNRCLAGSPNCGTKPPTS